VNKPDSNRLCHLLSVVAIVGISAFGIAVVSLHFLPTGYSPVTQAISDYAVGRYALVMELAFFALGIGVTALGLALSSSYPSLRLGRLGLASLLLGGVCFFAVGFSPTDIEGAQSTTVGIIHTSLSVMAFLCMIIGSLILSRRFRQSETWHPFYKSSMVIAILIFALVIILKITQVVGYVGIGERAFILSFCSWLLLTSIRIYRTS
jgi:hypothetical membrane protein